MQWPLFVVLFALGACTASSPCPNGRCPADAFASGDTSLPDDASQIADASTLADAGSTSDASGKTDASNTLDAGGGADASLPQPDAGPRSDAGTLSTGTPEPDEVRVNETVVFQTLDGIGANVGAFPFANDVGWDWDSVRWVFDDVDVPYVRFAAWFEWWETNNDNDDPTTINWSGFETVNQITSNHDVPFAQWLNQRGVEVSLGVWNVGDWLAGGSPRQVNADMYDELGESITAYLINMQNNGVPQPYAEVQNEPGITAALQYPGPEALRDAALALLDQLDRHGLSQVMLHGPNYHAPTGTAEWAQVWLANARLRDRTAALSFHTWWDDDFALYDGIRRLAEQHGKPVWATEVGYCALPSGCFGGTHTLEPATWGTAWDYGMSYYRAIAWSRATRVYHWTLVGFDAAVTPTGEPTPSLHVFAQFANYIPAGAQLLESASGDPEVLVVAFAVPGGGRSGVLLNTSSVEKRMRLASIRGDVLQPRNALFTRQGEGRQPSSVSGPDAGGRVTLTLPPNSVTSLWF